MSNPTIGRTVLYKIHARDAEAINRRRADYGNYRRHLVPGSETPDGRQFHVGNAAHEGDVYPAVVVRVFSYYGESLVVNLKVLLDGNDDYWATSRAEGDEPGFWAWPARD